MVLRSMCAGAQRRHQCLVVAIEQRSLEALDHRQVRYKTRLAVRRATYLWESVRQMRREGLARPCMAGDANKKLLILDFQSVARTETLRDTSLSSSMIAKVCDHRPASAKLMGSR